MHGVEGFRPMVQGLGFLGSRVEGCQSDKKRESERERERARARAGERGEAILRGQTIVAGAGTGAGRGRAGWRSRWRNMAQRIPRAGSTRFVQLRV